jgi:translation initiation factor 2 beta subunit (eIF-2beta)/eIF-5
MNKMQIVNEIAELKRKYANCEAVIDEVLEILAKRLGLSKCDRCGGHSDVLFIVWKINPTGLSQRLETCYQCSKLIDALNKENESLH